ncbi:ParA family protein [Pedobacter suwonensis]|uniref:ParA family protein n=1 Tax=Pedobacter suwonensis TaxID=332999 RepID=UPI0036CC47DC
MVILIGNQKGGAGKSTLCLLLAYYLSMLKKKKVTVLDMDYQASISGKFEKAKILENDPIYEVIPSDLKYFPALLELLNQNRDEFVLIDLPGKMDDDLLIPIISSAELIICPFNYDEFSVDSTVLFSLVCREINSFAPVVYVPNRIKTTVKYETREEVDRVLSRFGKVSPCISDRIDFQRVGTVHIPAPLIPVFMPAMDFVYGSFMKKGKSP